MVHNPGGDWHPGKGATPKLYMNLRQEEPYISTYLPAKQAVQK